MQTKTMVIILAILFLPPLMSLNSWAGLDFGQDNLFIPGNHETAAFTWNLRDNPANFKQVILLQNTSPATATTLTINITPPAGETIDSACFFLVDRKFKQFKAILMPQRQDNAFVFAFTPTHSGGYRIETILKTDKDWVLLSHNIKLKAGKTKVESPDDKGYKVVIRKIPEKAYTKHVSTLVFEISYNGQPVTDLEQINGAELHLATWGTSIFRRFAKFTYATSKQNLGGPEAAVSLVFRDNGRHKIFTTFKHRGKTHIITTELNVHLETAPGEERIYEQSPSEM